MLPKNVLYYGKEEPLPQQRALRAGPLSLIYEAGDLRYIKLGDREILRRVYVAIRDRNWGTLTPVISNVKTEASGDSFSISYDVENKQGDIDFFWKGKITGDVKGTINFSMEGVARSTFQRNRIGFCILHPVRECAGGPCTVEKVDGKVERGTFPKHISPHQPFMDMKAISHEVIPGVLAEVRFAGDIFEMEDQRNWTDASYKTYCTPLRLPYPAEVKKGTTILQSVTLTLKGKIPESRSEPRIAGLTFTVGQTPSIPLPPIGLGVASHGGPLSHMEMARLKALNLGHLSVDLSLSQPDCASTLRRAASEARSLGMPLEVAIFLSDKAADELKALAALLGELKPSVRAWLVFYVAEKTASERWVKLARDILKSYNPDAKIGSGTNAYFVELNRRRPPVGALDLVSYSINPQVHAFDNSTLVENLEAQALTIESARQFAGGKPLAVSPITLRPRSNPDATGPAPDPAPGELPSPVDVRQMSLFGAGWTLGSIKHLSEVGAYSLTYYETTGWRGVMETEAGSPLPGRFRSLPGSVFPLYHVLADVGELVGGKVIPTVSSDPLRVDGLAVAKDGRRRVVLANLTLQPQRVMVQNLSERVRVRHLNETNAEEAMVSPEAFRSQAGELLQTSAGTLDLDLLPYAVARIDMM